MRNILYRGYRRLSNCFASFAMRAYWDEDNIIPKSTGISKGSYLSRTRWGIFSGCGTNCSIMHADIGNYVLMSWNITIGARNHIYSNFSNVDYFWEGREAIDIVQAFGRYSVKIHDDVWIGCNAIVLPGCEIGRGAIIGAGAVVTKSVPAYSIVGGNPAKVVGRRFAEEKIHVLEASRWWEMEPKEVIKLAPSLQKAIAFDLNKHIERANHRKPDLSMPD